MKFNIAFNVKLWLETEVEADTAAEALGIAQSYSLNDLILRNRAGVSTNDSAVSVQGVSAPVSVYE